MYLETVLGQPGWPHKKSLLLLDNGFGNGYNIQ